MTDVEIREKRWAMKPDGKPELVTALASQLNISKTLATLLVRRGITTFDQARLFFRPSVTDLHDPFLMTDMDKAVTRLEEAIFRNEKILVYGDYDVDGTTAVALVYSFIKSFYENVDFYLPDRYKEGYGVSTAGIEFAALNDFKLIIALDCGIKSNDKVHAAKLMGVDFIICDHHRPGETLPEAVAVLDPKRADDYYPFDELSGCGIGFKFISGYAQKHKIPFKEIEQYLDLVAISTAADIVPLVGENRVLVHFGLKQLNYKPRLGIKAILEMEKVPVYVDVQEDDRRVPHYNLTVNDLVFIIGPRINAAGRIHDAKHAVELLISENSAIAITNSLRIKEHNEERKSLDVKITQEAFDMIQADPEFSRRRSTVLFNGSWHKGVIGIVASRLTEKYYRPTIILTESNGMATGSARSVKDFDVYNAIESCSDLLEQFGGHMYAAGLTMKIENIEKFKERFEEIVASTIEEHMLTQEIEIDSMLRLSEITPSFFNILKQFAPFGPGNMNPVFRSDNVRDTGMSRVVGNNHLKLNLAEDETTRFGMDGIAFQMGQHFSFISRKIPFDVCYSLDENTFNNKTSIQMNVKDIKLK
ncbi:MAG: single-stranded-DNA-specific exonuclease RecJ [Bacteroidetes bacterium]|nr:single-stranded-DNA-specific exonuclease RecJ [Bacteroidota bacterium]MBK8586769.1 single-stranded-DNA-specific exonuclease RecJ [Bacteroidota bacterium]MBP9790931.1 single-stranded-DNA-specific exonuclease RecJ [Bacteroidia bacterium]